jgi:hypothetical protein
MRKYFIGFSALVVSAAISWAATIPLITGPQDPSQLLATINQLITTINNSVGVLNFSAGPLSSSVTASQADLQTYTLSTNYLSPAGQGIRVSCWGASTGTRVKTIALYFGAHSLSFTNSQGSTNWFAQLTALKTGTTSDSVYGTGAMGSSLLGTYASLGTDPLSISPTNVKCAAIQASAQDITSDGMLIELLK